MVAAFDTDVATLARLELLADGGANDPFPADRVVPNSWRPHRPQDPAVMCYFDGSFNEQGVGGPGQSVTRILAGYASSPDGSADSRVIAGGTAETLPVRAP